MSNPSQEKEQKAETLIAVRSVRVVISGLMWEATISSGHLGAQSALMTITIKRPMAY